VDNWKVRRVSDDIGNVNERTLRDDLTKEQIEELQAVQKEQLGPRELRPVKPHNTLKVSHNVYTSSIFVQTVRL